MQFPQRHAVSSDADSLSRPLAPFAVKKQLQHARRLLCRLQDHIQRTILAAREREARKFARVVAETAADR